MTITSLRDYEAGSLLREFRSGGWRVAIHNDYDQGGESFTFWLFTHAATGRFVKGEGKTDIDAIRMAFESKTEGERLFDEQPPQDQIFVWTCGCGTVNGVNLATCRVCGRKEGEGQAARTCEHGVPEGMFCGACNRTVCGLN